MVALRSVLMLSAVTGIASAGHCKPKSSTIFTSTAVSETTSAGLTTLTSSDVLTTAASTILSDSTTDTADTTVETSTKETETTTETSSQTLSTEAISTISTETAESSLTTLVTSFTMSGAETTITESATTTTSAAPVAITCPSDVQQCLGTMEIQCGSVLFGRLVSTEAANLDECAYLCASVATCYAFTYQESNGLCSRASDPSDIIEQLPIQGWDSGIKGLCGE